MDFVLIANAPYGFLDFTDDTLNITKYKETLGRIVLKDLSFFL